VGAVSTLGKELAGLGVKDPEVVALYALVLALEGVSVLDGTTKFERMKADLEGLGVVGRWAEGEGRETWQGCLQVFKETIGENSRV